MDISLDPFYSQSSQFMFGCGRPELSQQTAPQTPQTPSSIPDIVLQGLLKVLQNVFGNPYFTLVFSRNSRLLQHVWP